MACNCLDQDQCGLASRMFSNSGDPMTLATAAMPASTNRKSINLPAVICIILFSKFMMDLYKILDKYAVTGVTGEKKHPNI